MIFVIDMKEILLIILAALAITSATAKKGSEKPVKVSYIVQSQHEAENDLITIVMRFELFDASLEEAYLEANELLEEIEQTIDTFCEENKIDEYESCNGVFEKGEFHIEPIYQRFRGIQTFKNFFLSFEVTLHVSATDNIGYLVDQLVINKKAIIEEMKWEELQSQKEQNLMEKGMRHGIETCENLGLSMKKIESVEVVEAEKVSKLEAEQPEEGEEEEEQEPEPSNVEGIIELKNTDYNAKYKFSVLCAS